MEAWFFPAALRLQTAPQFAESVLDDAEANCFFHESNRAAVACGSCGRFICSLCDVELEGQHLCPQCVATGQTKGKLTRLEESRIWWDHIALTAATAPLLIFWLTLFSAPFALYLVIRHWRTPLGILKPRRKWRFVVAGLFAILEIIGWIAGITYIVKHQ